MRARLFLLTLALVAIANVPAAASRASVTPVISEYGYRGLTVMTDCAEPTVDTPYTDEFSPGGPGFTVWSDTPGVYTVRCNGEVVATRVVR